MKKRIAFGYKAYPFTIANYFRHALEKRPDVELFTFGEYFGDSIPWGSGMRLPMKYVKNVNLPLPPSITRPPWEMIKNKLPWEPDLVICVDAGFHLSSKPDCPYATVLTDPHVLGDWYKDGNRYADFVFGMQKYYLKDGEILLPYCCSPDHHYAMSDVEKDYDASLIGLHYEQRDRLVAALRNKGYKVLYDLGLVYDEYREQNNRATIGLNWSSLMDINARTMEIMAMKQVPLINRLPYLDELGLEEGRHYFGFSTIEEAVSKTQEIFANPELSQTVANNAYQLVHQRHTYEQRIQQIFGGVGL
jgi:spore maturation protein CgeB